MTPSTRDMSPGGHPGLQAAGGGRGITWRSMVLGTLTAGAIGIVMDYIDMRLHAGALVMSNLPMAAFLPFVFWLFLNTVLNAVSPRLALSGTELLVVLTMAWVAGTLPVIGWSGYWVGILSAPHYYASPENRWADLFFDFLPAWLLAKPTPDVIQGFYNGIPSHTAIPWGGWLSPYLWWFSAGVAVIAGGLGLVVIFKRQWMEAERLTFPLALLPMELVRDFDGTGRTPWFVRSRAFWIGFAWPASILIWNAIGYFFVDFPRIALLDNWWLRWVHYARNYPPFPFRVLPTVIGFTFLCPLEILFSIWFFYGISTLQVGAMARTGFSVGAPGQPATPQQIVGLEGHGALTFLVLWSVWIARRHLREVWRAACSQDRRRDRGDGGISYRTALLCLLFSGAYLLLWLWRAGMHPLIGVGWLFLLFVSYFGMTKYLAASGFAYLFPGGVDLGTFVGTANIASESLTALGLVGSGAFWQGGRGLGMHVMAHAYRMLGAVRTRLHLIPVSVWIAFLVGGAVASGYILYVGYTESAMNLRSYTLVTGNTATWNRVASSLDPANRTVFDGQKLVVWLCGGAAVALLTLLRAQVTWWPLHPVGLAFMATGGVRVYVFSIFLTWLAKTLVLRLGGASLYGKVRPAFLGIAIGYTVGIGISMLVDYLFFPGRGHTVHGW